MECAASIVARGLAQRSPSERGKFLREMLAHTAAGLIVLEGDREATEALYRLSDAVVSRRLPEGA